MKAGLPLANLLSVVIAWTTCGCHSVETSQATPAGETRLSERAWLAATALLWHIELGEEGVNLSDAYLFVIDAGWETAELMAFLDDPSFTAVDPPDSDIESIPLWRIERSTARKVIQYTIQVHIIKDGVAMVELHCFRGGRSAVRYRLMFYRDPGGWRLSDSKRVGVS